MEKKRITNWNFNGNLTINSIACLFRKYEFAEVGIRL
jgi:hypothetical protein